MQATTEQREKLHAMRKKLREAENLAGIGRGGWNRKTLEEHKRDGTYQEYRHGKLAPATLNYPKPSTKCKAGMKSQRRWIRSAADEYAVLNGCRFNERLAEHAAGFFPKFLRHSKDPWRGKPFELLDWQRDDVIYPLFGWVHGDTGIRRFKRCFIEIAKKNGKSTMAAGIGLYMLTADCEGGAEVYSVASDKFQAGIVHREAISMVDASPELTAVIKLNRSTNNILHTASNSWYRALAGNAKAFEGLNIHCAIIDELHIWYGREGWDALRYGFRARRQPLQFVITTAGDDEQSVCYGQLEHARNVIAGTVRDEELLPLIYESSPEDDWTTEEVWQKANPSLGTIFSADALRQDAENAKGHASEEAAFKRYSLNIWAKATNPWLSPDDWNRNRREFNPADMKGRECYGGLDLSRTRDMTALALVFPWDEDGKRVYYRQCVRFWLPRAAIERYKNVFPIEQWRRDGWLEIMEDNYDPVEAAILEAAQSYDLMGVAFDEMYARDFMLNLETNHGIQATKFPQTIMSYAGPTSEYERLLIHESLHHDGNPVLSWQAGHVQVKTDVNANKRPVKPNNEDCRKIDGIVAGIMALDLATRVVGQSAYSDSGVMYVGEAYGDEEETEEEETYA